MSRVKLDVIQSQKKTREPKNPRTQEPMTIKYKTPSEVASVICHPKCVGACIISTALSAYVCYSERMNNLLTAHDVSGNQEKERKNPKNNQGLIPVAHLRCHLDGHRWRRCDEV